MSPKGVIPSCFCDRQGICKKHSQFEPTIESMIGLIGDQLSSVKNDERSVGDNLDLMTKAMDTIVFARKDTFKEQITRAYASKEDELDSYRRRCEDLEQREESFAANERQLHNLAVQNLRLEKELAGLRNTAIRKSNTM